MGVRLKCKQKRNENGDLRMLHVRACTTKNAITTSKDLFNELNLHGPTDFFGQIYKAQLNRHFVELSQSLGTVGGAGDTEKNR